MWNVRLGRLLDLVAQLLSEDKNKPEQSEEVVEKPNANATTHNPVDHGFLKKVKRSPRRKREYPKPPNIQVDHSTLTTGKTGLKSTFENLGENPFLIIPEDCAQDKISRKRKRYGENEFKTPRNINQSRTLPQPPPVLPPTMMNHIVQTGGCLEGMNFVIKKELFDSDVSKNLNRLSIPYGKSDLRFLTLEEVEYFKAPKAEILATLVEPCLKECRINFRNWESNSMYVLTTTWNDVWMRNMLRRGTMIQLWSFRRNSELCFALVRIED
ncbi:hypothetical protein CDL12_14944 [Handroanthus impetiginosus]|uniref:TF-B3 domain-containing protein n=1 Tax=Handroanthus impetiginosus TaxID=429701 RepID=A0A2G9H4J8_9LAMI|nr:hypothetical protein CDL12_14944 [Handroanthus impetiginosus]